jgi:hypothetical protein
VKLYFIFGQFVDDGYLSANLPAPDLKIKNKTNVKNKKIATKICAQHVLPVLPILVFSKFSQRISEGSLQIRTSASSPSNING